LLMPPHLKVKAPFCNYDVIILLAEVRAAAVVARGADGAAPGGVGAVKFGFGMAGVGGLGRVPNVGQVDEVAAG
jgi:hypothetical protein